MKRTYVYDLRVAEGNVPYLKKVRSTTKVDVNEGINSPEKIAKASKIIGLMFVDHLIIGKYGNFYSFREHNTI